MINEILIFLICLLGIHSITYWFASSKKLGRNVVSGALNIDSYFTRTTEAKA